MRIIFYFALFCFSFQGIFVCAQPPSISQSSRNQSSSEIILDVLDLKGMDVLDVLRLISQKSGLNIVAGQNVKGRVTVFLKNVTVEQALKIIVEAYDWAYAKEGETIKVMTDKEFEAKYGYRFGQNLETRVKQVLFVNTADLLAVLNQIKTRDGKIVVDEKSRMLILMDEPTKLDEFDEIIEQIDVPTQTVVFDLNYAKAEEVSGKIAELLTPSVGRMKFDDRSNKVIVSDTNQKLKDIEKMIKAFDQKDKEVYIEAKILEVSLSDEQKLGIDWQGLVEDYHSLKLTNDFNILSDSEKKGRLSIGTIASDDYEIMLEALETIGTTNLLSTPRITTVNNKEAKILVGSSEPYVTSTTTTPASGSPTTAETVNFIEVGVKLYVTPTIHNDGFITMKIKPEVSSAPRRITTGNNNQIPIVDTSEAETTVLVKDGVTIIIGGLIKELNSRTVSKVPLLGNVPVIGMAFRNKENTVEKSELVIFLTPRIITGDVMQTPLTKEASDALAKSVSLDITEIATSDGRNIGEELESTPKTDVEKNAFANYDKLVREKIKERANEYLSNPEFSPGDVYLTFVLTSTGNLKYTRIVEDKTSANQFLRNLGLKSIEEASPFPPFPRELDFSALTFNLLLSFKSEN